MKSKRTKSKSKSKTKSKSKSKSKSITKSKSTTKSNNNNNNNNTNNSKKTYKNITKFVPTYEIKSMFTNSCDDKIKKIKSSLYSKKELLKYCECIKSKLTSHNIDKYDDDKNIKRKIKKCMSSSRTKNKTRLSKLYSKKYLTYLSKNKKSTKKK